MTKRVSEKSIHFTSPSLSLKERIMASFRLSKLKKHAHFIGKGVRCLGKLVLRVNGELNIGAQSVLLSDFQNTRLAVGKGASLTIGKNCCINSVIIAANHRVKIGDHCHFGPFVHLMDSDFHDLEDRSKAGKSGPIIIGDCVQLGTRVIVLRGVSIGNNAEVLPGSVVTKNVPAGAKVGGIPAVELV